MAIDQATSRQICALIAGVLHSDDELHPDETSFFGRVLERFGLPPDAPIAPTTDHAEVVQMLGQLPDEAKMETLDLLVIAAAADGRVVPAERLFLGVVADELGIAQDLLDDKLFEALV